MSEKGPRRGVHNMKMQEGRCKHEGRNEKRGMHIIMSDK